MRFSLRLVSSSSSSPFIFSPVRMFFYHSLPASNPDCGRFKRGSEPSFSAYASPLFYCRSLPPLSNLFTPPRPLPPSLPPSLLPPLYLPPASFSTPYSAYSINQSSSPKVKRTPTHTCTRSAQTPSAPPGSEGRFFFYVSSSSSLSPSRFFLADADGSSVPPDCLPACQPTILRVRHLSAQR